MKKSGKLKPIQRAQRVVQQLKNGPFPLKPELIAILLNESENCKNNILANRPGKLPQWLEVSLEILTISEKHYLSSPTERPGKYTIDLAFLYERTRHAESLALTQEEERICGYLGNKNRKNVSEDKSDEIIDPVIIDPQAIIEFLALKPRIVDMATRIKEEFGPQGMFKDLAKAEGGDKGGAIAKKLIALIHQLSFENSGNLIVDYVNPVLYFFNNVVSAAKSSILAAASQSAVDDSKPISEKQFFLGLNIVQLMEDICNIFPHLEFYRLKYISERARHYVIAQKIGEEDFSTALKAAIAFEAKQSDNQSQQIVCYSVIAHELMKFELTTPEQRQFIFTSVDSLVNKIITILQGLLKNSAQADRRVFYLRSLVELMVPVAIFYLTHQYYAAPIELLTRFNLIISNNRGVLSDFLNNRESCLKVWRLLNQPAKIYENDQVLQLWRRISEYFSPISVKNDPQALQFNLFIGRMRKGLEAREIKQHAQPVASERSLSIEEQAMNALLIEIKSLKAEQDVLNARVKEQEGRARALQLRLSQVKEEKDQEIKEVRDRSQEQAEELKMVKQELNELRIAKQAFGDAERLQAVQKGKLAEAKKQLSQGQSELQKAKNSITRLSERLDKTRQNLAEQQEAHQVELQAMQNSNQHLTQQLTEAREKLRTQQTSHQAGRQERPDSIQQLKLQLSAAQKKLKDQRETHQLELQKMRNSMDQVSGKLAEAQKQLETQQEADQAERQKTRELVQGLTQQLEEAQGQAEKQKAEHQADRQRMQELVQQLTQQLKEAQAQLEKQQIDHQAELQKLEEAQAQLKQQHADYKAEHEKMQGIVQQLTQQLTEAQEQLNPRAEDQAEQQRTQELIEPSNQELAARDEFLGSQEPASSEIALLEAEARVQRQAVTIENLNHMVLTLTAQFMALKQSHALYVETLGLGYASDGTYVGLSGNQNSGQFPRQYPQYGAGYPHFSYASDPAPRRNHGPIPEHKPGSKTP